MYFCDFFFFGGLVLGLLFGCFGGRVFVVWRFFVFVFVFFILLVTL